MPLSPGTALQNGHYVIDALIETAPNGDLYWGTHVVTGMQVCIQVLPLATEPGGGDVSELITRLQGLSFSSQFPLPTPLQIFHEGDSQLCLAMGKTVGLPWDQVCRLHAPMLPRRALRFIQSIAEEVMWLQEQGVTTLDLSPNRIWITAAGDRITLTGLPQNHLAFSSEPLPETLSTVQSLAILLYSSLIGELPKSSDPDALLSTLKATLPTLSPLIAQAIYRGAATTPSSSVAEDVQLWLTLLPEMATHSLRATPAEAAPPSQASPPPSRRWSVYPALGATALVAAIGGVTLGIAWRLNASSLPGVIQFDPNQSFPPQADWAGDIPKATQDTPFGTGSAGSDAPDRWSPPEWDGVSPETNWSPDSPEWPGEPEWLYDNTQDLEATDLDDTASDTFIPPSPQLVPEDESGSLNDIVAPTDEQGDSADPVSPKETPVQLPSGNEVFSNATDDIKFAPTVVPDLESEAAPASQTTSES